MTTTDTAALLRAVLAEPAEDTTRLVYADALEEQGEGERAEFIRVQVEYAQIHATAVLHGVCECDVCKRADWLSVLLLGRFRIPSQSSPSWARDCPGRIFKRSAAYSPRIEWDWHRGFVSDLRCPAADFLQHARAIFSSQPVTSVVLTNKEPGRSPGGVWRWWWRDEVYVPITRDELPYEIFCTGLFSTRAEALAALSDSCVAWGRSLVGLPPLKG